MLVVLVPYWYNKREIRERREGSAIVSLCGRDVLSQERGKLVCHS